MRTLIVLMVCAVAYTPTAFARKWTDSTGKYSREGEFIELKDGQVWLKQANGEKRTIAFEKLSKPDQEYVKQQTKQLKPKATTSKPNEILPADPAPTIDENEQHVDLKTFLIAFRSGKADKYKGVLVVGSGRNFNGGTETIHPNGERQIFFILTPFTAEKNGELKPVSSAGDWTSAQLKGGELVPVVIEGDNLSRKPDEDLGELYHFAGYFEGQTKSTSDAISLGNAKAATHDAPVFVRSKVSVSGPIGSAASDNDTTRGGVLAEKTGTVEKAGVGSLEDTTGKEESIFTLGTVKPDTSSGDSNFRPFCNVPVTQLKADSRPRVLVYGISASTKIDDIAKELFAEGPDAEQLATMRFGIDHIAPDDSVALHYSCGIYLEGNAGSVPISIPSRMRIRGKVSFKAKVFTYINGSWKPSSNEVTSTIDLGDR